jgi:type III pantothenate kinase
MRKILAIDIGNTNITVGSFGNGRLLNKAKIPTGAYSGYRAGLKRFLKGCGSVVISSVVPVALSRVLVELKKCGAREIMVTGRDIIVPVKNLYRRKGEVGQDRLVNAFAAKRLYGSPAVIVDFGTAITFDIVSRKGEYVGGLILPGIEMGLKSLYERTALLPRIELKEAADVIGKDTVSSMRGGILFGYGALVDGLVAKYRSILGPRIKVIATGGNASLVSRYAGSVDVVDDDLTLKGLSLLA